MVLIKEFFPNPSGKDTEGEWIKLFNNSNTAVDVSGWQIKDASAKAFIFSATDGKNTLIAGGEILTLDYKTTKISLNNNGETIFLYDKNGILVDKAEYTGTAADGKVYIRAENGKFILSGSQAELQEVNSIPAPTSFNNKSANSGAIINNSNLGLNFSIGIFIALVLTVLFIFISKKLELFSGDE
ncbi:MAG: lamin tail domain-containing protein [Spirochaetia bacterium]|nr:MAG: lamin tail domain-containing protein [Spirochaetia bacterium]